jgi:hypothetical protein
VAALWRSRGLPAAAGKSASDHNQHEPADALVDGTVRTTVMHRDHSATARSSLEWLFAALNSAEMASLPWSTLAFSVDTGDTPASKRLDEFPKARLKHLEPVLAGKGLERDYRRDRPVWRLASMSEDERVPHE